MNSNISNSPLFDMSTKSGRGLPEKVAKASLSGGIMSYLISSIAKRLSVVAKAKFRCPHASKVEKGR